MKTFLLSIMSTLFFLSASLAQTAPGKTSAPPEEALKAHILTWYDSDNDGQLKETEFAALNKVLGNSEAAFVPGGKAAFDLNTDGKLTADEYITIYRVTLPLTKPPALAEK